MNWNMFAVDVFKQKTVHYSAYPLERANSASVQRPTSNVHGFETLASINSV